ncbi:MAG: reverse transcriptase/maturase family protein, partial [Candidatus Competibacteraceae bacterium]|nr:reverse transcriptase/maturase family protein [Candidatus Competibacteraceae bacterium]
LVLHRDLRDGRFRPSPYRLTVVHDPKTRLIAAPAITDRIVQQALLTDIGPCYERGFIDHSYACCLGRGPQRAVLRYLDWTRRYPFRLSLDIRGYFASIHHDTLLGLFAHRLRDRDTLELIAGLLAAGGQVYRSPLAVAALDQHRHPVPAGCGLPLGGYLSHWSGGLYLDGLDHFVKRTLKIPAYLRYMDDFSLFADNPRRLEQARERIARWLEQERRLHLNPKRQRVMPTTQPSIFLGYRVSRAGLRVGPKAKRRLKRRLHEADSLSTERLVRSLRAYRGMGLTLE